MKTNLVPIRRPAAAEPALSDEAVALACAAGDPAAVAELFDRFRQAVARYLSRVLVNPHDVEDCLQATFLEVARGRAQFSGRSSASTWLFGVATNVARHQARSAGRRTRLAGALRLAGDDEAAAPPDGALDARQRLERLRRALAALSDERREAFVLCELEGLSAREAAEALGVAETAVWKRVSDARKALRAENDEGPMNAHECEKRGEFEAWSRLGAKAPLPGELRAHAARCGRCGAFVDEVEGLRGVMRELAAPRIDERRFDEMRFALMAEARKAQQARGEAPPAGRARPARRAWGRPLAFAAAAAMLAGGAAWATGYAPALVLAPAPPAEAPGAPGAHGAAKRPAAGDGAAMAPPEAGAPASPPEPPPAPSPAAPDAAPPVVEAPAARPQALNGPTPARAADAKRPPASTKAGPPEAGGATSNAAGGAAPGARPDAARGDGRAAARPDASAAVAAPNAPAAPPQYDVAFRAAWHLLREGKAADAARAFDALSGQPGLDPGRRADALYWAARSHQQAGDLGAASSRAERLAQHDPGAWHAPQAALMVGEGLARKGDVAGARRWLERARGSGHAEVRARAEAVLATLPAR